MPLHKTIHTTLCAGDTAQPDSEPDNPAGVVLRLWQGGVPGAQTGPSLAPRQQQAPSLSTDCQPGKEFNPLNL